MARLLSDVDPPRLSRLLLALLALSLATTSVSGVSMELQHQHRRLRVFGRDDRVQVPSAVSPPYSAIGLLRWNAETLCTASLVANAIIVTAAECVLDKSGDELPRDAEQQPAFFPGITHSSISSLQSPTSVPSAQVAAVHKQSDYWVKWTDNTYVLLSLASPLGASVGTLGLPALGELDAQMEKTPVQMASYRIDDQAVASLTYQSCTCRFPLAFGGAEYLLHHDCDATSSGSPGAPLLVNYSSTETYILGVHSNRVGGDGSVLDDTEYETYNDAVANRGVMAPYIQQHLSYLTTQGASGSGSVSTAATSSFSSGESSSPSGGAPTPSGSSGAKEAEAEAESSSSPTAESTDVVTPISSTMNPAVAVVCIGFVAVAWACIVFIATRRARRRRSESPEPLIDGEQ
jgi:protease YdgD